MINSSQERILIDIYNKYFIKLYRYFFYKTLDKALSEDLTSDTFLRFADCVSGEAKIDDYVKFLYGIANNVFMEALRKKYSAQFITGIEWDVMSEELVDDFIEDADKVDNAQNSREELAKKYIKLLPVKQRKILTLRLIERLSLKEICEKIGKDMNYVKTTQKRAIKSLKELAAKVRMK